MVVAPAGQAIAYRPLPSARHKALGAQEPRRITLGPRQGVEHGDLAPVMGQDQPAGRRVKALLAPAGDQRRPGRPAVAVALQPSPVAEQRHGAGRLAVGEQPGDLSLQRIGLAPVAGELGRPEALDQTGQRPTCGDRQQLARVAGKEHSTPALSDGRDQPLDRVGGHAAGLVDDHHRAPRDGLLAAGQALQQQRRGLRFHASLPAQDFSRPSLPCGPDHRHTGRGVGFAHRRKREALPRPRPRLQHPHPADAAAEHPDGGRLIVAEGRPRGDRPLNRLGRGHQRPGGPRCRPAR